MKLFLTIFLLFIGISLQGQSNFSLKYFGLTIHPFGDELAEIQPNKLDKEARFVLNLGGFATYEKFIWEDILAVTISQGIFNDCSRGIAGVSHIGILALLLEKKNIGFI